MNAKEQLNKIKTLLGLQVKFEQAKLVDGAVVEAEAFEPEYSISIIANDEKVPMPVGAYETEDGKIITVEQEGIIAKVEDKPAEVEEVEASSEEVVEVQQQPKQIKEIREINFNKQPKKMKKGKIKIQFTEEAAEEVMEVSQEILEQISEIINEETPESVSAEDSKEIAVDIIEAIVEILEEQPEAFRKKKKFATQVAEPIVHNPENAKKVEVQKYGKSSGIRENIYKQLFN